MLAVILGPKREHVRRHEVIAADWQDGPVVRERTVETVRGLEFRIT